MPFRYIPILRWKRGERVGLQHLTQQARQRAVPLLLLATDQYKVRPATKTRAQVPAPDAFAHEVQQAWGPSPFMLDASAVPAGTGAHPLQAIAAACAGAGLQMIPATNLGAPQAYQAAVNAVAQAGAGVALRVDMQEVSSIAGWIGQWPHSPGQTDLIIDLGSGIRAAAQLGNAVNPAFQNVHGGAQWRSVTLAGTSMPQNFTGYIAGPHLIPRREWALWQQLSGANLPYQLDYGDFTATSPGAPPPGIAWGYPISVRYTLPNEFLICRGVGTTGPQGVDPGVQLQGHANTIRAHPQRHALPQTWADATIDLIAMGGAGPQGLEHWVQLSVNRHIELVATMLP